VGAHSFGGHLHRGRFSPSPLFRPGKQLTSSAIIEIQATAQVVAAEIGLSYLKSIFCATFEVATFVFKGQPGFTLGK
jgi:hypothetical protein